MTAARRATPAAPPAASPEHEPEDAFWMDRSLALARQALAAGETPVGAVVVRGDRLLGAGAEATRATRDPTAHAEVVAIRQACAAAGAGAGTPDLAGATLYTTVEPCVLCAYAARQVRVARVVYGAPAGAWGGATGPCALLADASPVSAAAWGPPPTVVAGVRAADCAAALAEAAARRQGRGEGG